MEVEENKKAIVQEILKSNIFSSDNVKKVIENLHDKKRFVNDISEADNVFQEFISNLDRNNDIHRALRNSTENKITERFFLEIEHEKNLEKYDICVTQYSNEKIPEGFLYSLNIEKY